MIGMAVLFLGGILSLVLGHLIEKRLERRKRHE